ncbi:MAG: 3-hydroxyacyl-CoA dehydrogenase [Candidatus Protistobacter heckmanni]|nr:3-hydroxyacyl-CoA dehydrogenase [Candidatus Protistobacter heckmanni]
MRLEGSVFLVTGGASGLGEAVARHFHGAGARVGIADLNEAAGKALAAELGARAAFFRCDVSSEADAAQAVDGAVSTFGALHGLVNCAGIAPGEKVLGKQGPHRLDSFSLAIRVNLIGSFNMLRLSAQAMARNEPNAAGERGVVINTASIAAFDGQIGQAAYAASKGGVVGMTLPIARELASSGIRVATIAPGLFLTPMMKGLPQQVQDSLAENTPFPKRLGRPEEYAQLARHIVENEMLNGEVIRLDGAVRLAPR